MRFLRVLVCSLALLGSSSLVAAQTGPWTDGELLLSTYLPASQVPAIWRIVPETGSSAVLVTPQSYSGSPGGLVFDNHRGGVLANISLPPDNIFVWRLWFVSHDGTAAAMPGAPEKVRALASAGDGRVFFQEHLVASQGPKPIQYYDANDVIHTLKAVDGVTPFQIEVEHLLYHAPSNSLIGSSSGWWSLTDCGPAGGSLYRIPLSGDGLKVAGAVECISTSNVGIEEIMSLDLLPGGSVLVTFASGGFYPYAKLRALDPLSMTLSAWAQPDQFDVNGGVYSARLGKVVVHAAWTGGYELRTFVSAQANIGSPLPTTAALGTNAGYTPIEILARVDTNGPGCLGFQIAYGAGLPGSGGLSPLLGAIGCPDIGQVFTLSINSVVGGASGILFVGLNSGAIPFKGGIFHLGSVALQVPIAVGGAPGVADAGSLALSAVINDPILAGLSIYMQAGFLDALATQGVSLSNGLRLQAQ